MKKTNSNSSKTPLEKLNLHIQHERNMLEIMMLTNLSEKDARELLTQYKFSVLKDCAICGEMPPVHKSHQGSK